MSKPPSGRAFFVINVCCTDGIVSATQECSHLQCALQVGEMLECPESFRMRAIERWGAVPAEMFLDTESGHMIIPCGFGPFGTYSISELSVAQLFDQMRQTNWNVIGYGHEGDEQLTRTASP